MTGKNKYMYIIISLISIVALVISLISLLSGNFGLSILDSISFILSTLSFIGIIYVVYFLYKLNVQNKQLQSEVKESNNQIENISDSLLNDTEKAKVIAKNFEIIVSVTKNITISKEKIIKTYSDLMDDKNIKDETVKNRLLQSPEILKCISELRKSLYSIKQIKNLITYEDDNTKFNSVLDSLRDFSNANISELIDNLDYLTAMTEQWMFLGRRTE